ncbi:DNA repair protein RecO [Desulforhopalus singaporensis]|uniref:DNA repair protein RecO n=1 Tax=Desulforhopalus singaporensis TaxID=91360 RepID=A0A1H0NDC5_9BACT|nr:DNA repair protein RecO [Desulforhopalus singaporensis]SDO90536.1 DNA replication and repair protein RecO [Desulforhopalus singaporensis]
MQEDALVLDTVDHGESDLIVTFYGHRLGRHSAIAKGARKSKKRFVNKLEQFTFLNITSTIKANRSLGFLVEAELYTSFPGLRRNPRLYIIASIVVEFLLLGTREAEPDPKIFRLSLWALHNIEHTPHPMATLALFLIRYFGLLGYRPDLDNCGGCNEPFTNDATYRFDPAGGRIVCSNCRSDGHFVIPVANGTIKALRAAQQLDLDRLQRVSLKGTILEQSLTLARSFGYHIFQREAVSWKTLKNFESPKDNPL